MKHTNKIATRTICWSELIFACLFTTADVRAAQAFSDANWISMGGSIAGADGPVYATAVDGAGNLYIGGSFTVVGDVLATNIAKWNGSSWSALGSGLDGSVNALAMSGSEVYAAGSFTTAGGLAANHIAKWNGSSWSALGSGFSESQSPVQAMAVVGTDLYAGGDFTNAGGIAANRIAKWNGSSWSALGSGMNGSVNALASSGGNLYAGGFFTTAGGVAAANVARWNGSSWSALGSGLSSAPPGVVPVSALAVSGGDLYAGGTFTRAGGLAATNIARWNGSSWSALSLGLNNALFGRPSSVSALAVSGSDLYVGGSFITAGGIGATNIAKWNGSSWSALGPGILSSVLTLAASGSNLFAGGDFVPQNGPAHGIARWNGSSWSALGPGLNNEVSLLAVLGSDLYAAGWFTTIGGGTNANYIARWIGNSWSPLGSGTGGIQNPYLVRALAVSGTNLYVGGTFTTAGGIAATNIAMWNGTDWSALGSGINGFGVSALAVLGHDLYAGGGFTNAGGVPARAIAKWNGSTWSALSWTGSVSLDGISVLTVCGSNLLAAGAFSTNGEPSANHIAKWDGSSWTVLGSTLGTVRALAVVGTNLYAGGWFGIVQGNPFDHIIAKWDGSSWSAVGSGLGAGISYDYVEALAVSGSNLYAGGHFTRADGIAVNHIAKWDGSSWSALGSGMGGGILPSVNALQVSGGDLYAGGSFTTAGGKVSVNLARARLSFTPDSLALQANVPGAHTNSLTFAGVPGFPYVVEYATNLSGSPWFTLSTNAPAANGVGEAIDPAATDAQRFYRVGFQE